MINVTDTIKEAYSKSTTQYDKIVLDDEEYAINNVELDDDCYEEGNIFGTAIAKALSFEIDSSVDLEGKEFKYFTGIKTTAGIEWIDLGTYITQDVEINDTTRIATINAMDYMLKTNIEYISDLQYSNNNITLGQVAQEACNKAGITLATTNFPNVDFIVDSNQFPQRTLIRQVISAIAQISGTVAKVKNDDKLYFITPKTTGTVRKVFNLSDYSEAEIKRATHPINLVSLGMSDVEGENVVVRDEQSILLNGENSLVINDNPFAYTEEKRQQLITAIFNAVKGFEYKAYEMTGQGLSYLETLDNIQIVDFEGNTYSSFLFRFYHKSPNGLETEMSAPSITKATVAYQNVATPEQIAKRTEIIVNKQKQTITQLVQQTEEHEEKITQIEQSVEGITQQVSEIADITRTVIENNQVHIIEAMSVEPGTFKIYGNRTYFKYLYPSENLYPSDTLYPSGDCFTICIDKQSRNNSSEELKEYVIDLEEPLRNLGDVCDEFYVSNVDNIAKVIRRIGINQDGSLYVLEDEVEQNVEEIHLILFEGENYIYVKEFQNLKYEIEYAILNDFTKNFATNAEMNSKISQTSSQIMQEVNKKVDEDEFGTQLTLNYEALQLAWNQISQYLKMEGVNGKATLNIYDDANNMLMSLSDTGQKFYRSDGTEIGNIGLLTDSQGNNQLVFSLNTESSSDGMSWGIKNSQGQFFPIFQLVAFDYAEQSEYGGYFQMVATLDMLNHEIKLLDTNIVGEVLGGISIYDENGNDYFTVGADDFSICNNQLKFYKNSTGDYTLNFCQNNIADVDNLEAETISAGDIIADTIVQTSVKEKKKYVKKTDKKALELIRQADICQYQFKGEKADGHRHFGLVIGENYNCPSEIIAQNGKGIDTYSMNALAWKAIQELSEELAKIKQKEVRNEKN